MAPKPSSKSSSSNTFFAPLNPDQTFAGGGLPGAENTFKATVEVAITAPYDYSQIAYDGTITATDKTKDFWTPTIMLFLKPDPDSDMDEKWLQGVVQPYSAGKWDRHRPFTEDGQEVDVESWDGVNINDCAGVHLGFVGPKDSSEDKKLLSSNCNAAHLLEALRDAGFKGEFASDVRFLEGLYAEWSQLPQKSRPGLKEDDAGKSDSKFKKTILLPVKILKGGSTKAATGAIGKTAASTTAATGAGVKSKASTSSSKSQATDDTSSIDAAIAEFLGDKDDASLAQVRFAVVRALGGPAAKIINRAGFFDRPFMDSQGRVWELDIDKGKMVLSGGEEAEAEEEE